MNTCIQTHRCFGSLAVHVSVRYIYRDYDKRKMWVLRMPETDFDWRETFLSNRGQNDIKYCPYCGAFLQEV